ncbi:MAG: tetratricopeptide repeat protein [Planctomycetota bacterium]
MAWASAPTQLSSASWIAEPLLLEVFQGRETILGPEHPRIIDSLKQLVRLYEAWDKPEEAEKWRARLLQPETIEE